MGGNRRPRHRHRNRTIKHGRVHGLRSSNSRLKQDESHFRFWPETTVSLSLSEPQHKQTRPIERCLLTSSPQQSNSNSRPPNPLPIPKTTLPQPHPRRCRRHNLPPNRNLLRNHGLYNPLLAPLPRLIFHRLRSNGRRNGHRRLASRQRQSLARRKRRLLLRSGLHAEFQRR